MFAGALEWIGARAMTADVAVTSYIARSFPRKRTVLIQNFPMIDELHLGDRPSEVSATSRFVFLGMIVAHRGPEQMIMVMK